MRRLHLQIFRALVLTGLSCLCITAAVAWTLSDHKHRVPRFVENVGAFIVDDLPDSDQRAFAQQLERRARRLQASISVWSREGRLIARAGRRLGPERLVPGERSFFEHADGKVTLRLEDGRTLAISFDQKSDAFGAARFALALALLLGTLLLGSYLAARRITRRLERLERGVTSFGEGNLDARVPVRGKDEIARLAGAFNRSFDRIASLLKQQRRMLQSASHELRSPLARVRMALELATEPALAAEAREKLRDGAQRDIEELDALIGDLLLSGRLADTELPKEFEDVAFDQIVASEAARVAASCRVEPAQLRGNPRMLRSLVRNLLENARRHGADPVHASCAYSEGQLLLRVEDAGEGVAPAEQTRIFEPFYRPAGHREGKDGGVGLGLSLVKTIAEHHGGDACYVPCERGSCFEVRLPAISAGARSSTTGSG